MNGSDIQALIDAAPDQPGLRRTLRTPITVPPGDYEVTEPIVVDKCVLLDMRGVALYPADDTDALQFVGGSGWSSMLGCWIVGVQAGHQGIGIDCQAHGITLQDIMVREMHTGIRWWGTAGNGTNANGGGVRDAQIYGCHDLGIHLIGGDANAGIFSHIYIVGAGATRHAVLDDSFLGNAMHGLHASTTREEAYKVTASANYSTWTACYLESDCGLDLPAGAPKISAKPRVSWFGGNAIFHVPEGHGDRFGAGNSQAAFQGITPDGDTIRVALPHASQDAVMSVSHISGDPQTHPSGGLELMWKRSRKSRAHEMVMRTPVGQPKTALALTRNDSLAGRGHALVDPATKPITAEQIPSATGVGMQALASLPSPVTLGAVVAVVTGNSVQLYHGRDEGNGPYWQPLS